MPVDRRRLGGQSNVERIPREGPLPLSFGQQRVWFVEQLQASGSNLNNLSVAYLIRGQVDERRLDSALHSLVAREEILTTAFPGLGGFPVQRIGVANEPELEVRSFLNETGEHAERRALEFAAGRCAEPFDLDNGPLARLLLVRVAHERSYLVFCIHHIVADWWSLGLLMRRLHAFYERAAVDDSQSGNGQRGIQYVDFAAWQHEQMVGDEGDAGIGYWQRTLADMPDILDLSGSALPASLARQRLAGTIAFPIHDELARELKVVGREVRATLGMVLLAAFDVLLWGLSGQRDVGVGIPVTLRTRQDLENIAGLFLNTMVHRAKTSGDPSFLEVVVGTAQSIVEGMRYATVPFERVVDELRPVRDGDRNPLVQAAFTYRDRATGPVSLDGVTERWEYLPAWLPDRDVSHYELELFVTVDPGGGLVGRLVYSTDLFDRVTAERMAGHYRSLLEQVAARPSARLSELALLG